MASLAPYLATWRSHRRLLWLPIVAATVLAAWTVIGAPKSYVSSATLWVDTGGPAGSSLGNTNSSATPPSSQEQTVLDELLATKGFVSSVGSSSTLQSYLAAHTVRGFGPPALLSSVFGGAAGQLSDRVQSTLWAGVTTTTPGPQVLAVSFTGPTAAVAESTLRALVSQLRYWTTRYSRFSGQNQASYYQAQVSAEETALTQAQAQVQAYTSSHPHASQTSDPIYEALAQAASVAASELAQARSGLASAQDSSQAPDLIVREVDAPSLPTGPTAGKKKDLEGILGGLVAGLLVGILAIVVTTRGPQLRRRPQGLFDAHEPPGKLRPAVAHGPSPAVAHGPRDTNGRDTNGGSPGRVTRDGPGVLPAAPPAGKRAVDLGSPPVRPKHRLRP